MEQRHITATQFAKMRSQAKALRRTLPTLAAAQDLVAKQHGFLHWKHVSEAVAHSKRRREERALPDALNDFLQALALSAPAAPESVRAFESGLVFAMDVKEASDMRLPEGYSQCTDIWHLAAPDIWPLSVGIDQLERGSSATIRMEDEPLEWLMDEMHNTVLFRSDAPSAPSNLIAAQKAIGEFSFFGAQHIWLRGQFHSTWSEEEAD